MTEPTAIVKTAGIPPVGMHRTSDHRYFWNGEGPLPSVTTAMKMLDKSDVLVGWAKRETAAFAVRHLDVLAAHLGHTAADPLCVPCAKAGRPYDRDQAAQRWIASIPDYQADAARDLGTEVHRIAEVIGKGDEPDVATEFLPYAFQYRAFLEDVRPALMEVEYMGINEREGYAGTGDIIARIGSLTTLIDIKTHTKPTPIPETYYPETALQLAACARFDFIGKEGDRTRYPMPRIDRYAVLLISSGGWRLIPYWVTDATYEAFLACLALLRWKKTSAPHVVGASVKKEEAAA